MRKWCTAWCGSLLLAALAWAAEPTPPAAPAPALRKVGPYAVRVAQHVQDMQTMSLYPNALPTLLRDVRERTTVNLDPEPIIVSSLADPQLLELPFLYVNWDQRTDWQLAPDEIAQLKLYLERGGFMLVDAGITAEFLRQNRRGQHHSFAEWRARPELVEVMQQVFPDRTFQPLPRSHPLYTMYYRGLPDAGILPETVRSYVINEKWPQGTYSMVALTVNGRIAVLATPIIAMGWGKNQLGAWESTIGFRIREGAPNLSELLQRAANTGETFPVAREDGGQDQVFCQPEGMPAWVREPDGTYRVFRYYHSREISDFAHLFYSQLGFNILLYALTH
jgi:hypothetical protein